MSEVDLVLYASNATAKTRFAVDNFMSLYVAMLETCIVHLYSHPRVGVLMRYKDETRRVQIGLSVIIAIYIGVVFNFKYNTCKQMCRPTSAHT